MLVWNMGAKEKRTDARGSKDSYIIFNLDDAELLEMAS